MALYSIDDLADGGQGANIAVTAKGGRAKPSSPGPLAAPNANMAAPNWYSGARLATEDDIKAASTQNNTTTDDLYKGAATYDPGVLRGAWDMTLGGALSLAKDLYLGYQDELKQAKAGDVTARARYMEEQPDQYIARKLGVGILGMHANMVRKAFTAPTPTEAIGYLTAALIPIIGPAAAKIGEDISAGKLRYAAGESVGLLAPYLGRIGKDVAFGRLMPVTNASLSDTLQAPGRALADAARGTVQGTVTRPFGQVPPEMAQLGEFAKQEGVPLSAGQHTQNKYVKLLEKGLEADVGGQIPATDLRAAQQGAVRGLGDRLSAQIGPNAAVDTDAAGRAVYDLGLQKIAQWKAKARQHYREAYGEATAPPVKARNVPGMEHGGLSEDLIDQIMQPDGGFTYNVVTGDMPKTGYAVSIYPERTSTPLNVEAYKNLPKSEVRARIRAAALAYVERNRDLLLQPGNYLGPWHNPKTGAITWDVSRVVPDLDTAMTLGRKYKQDAIFDFEKGQSIPVVYDSNTTTGGGNGGDEGDVGDEADILSRWSDSGASGGPAGGNGPGSRAGGNEPGGSGGGQAGDRGTAGEGGRGTEVVAGEAGRGGAAAGVAGDVRPPQGGGPTVEEGAAPGGAAPEGPPPGMKIPTDMRKAKRALRPIYDELRESWPPTQQDANPAFTAIKKIVEGPDWREAGGLDSDLSVIKAGLRKTPTEFRGRAEALSGRVVSALEPALHEAVYKAGGPEAYVALQRAREATKVYAKTRELLANVRKKGPYNEPVTIVSRLMQPGDKSIELLRELNKELPDAMPHLARTWLEGQLKLSRDKGLFDSSVSNTMLNNWNRLGPQTKQITFGNEMIGRLDKFFRLTQKIGENVNPSGTAGSNAAMRDLKIALGAAAAVPVAGPWPLIAVLSGEAGSFAIAKLLYSDRISRALINWMSVASKPKASPTALAGAAAQLASELHTVTHDQTDDKNAKNAAK